MSLPQSHDEKDVGLIETKEIKINICHDEICKHYDNFDLPKIERKESIPIIYNFAINGIMPDVTADTDPTILAYIGYTYRRTGKIEKMLEYYAMAADRGNSHAIKYMICYYGKIDYNSVILLKYRLVAVAFGDQEEMNSLGSYYFYQNDHDNCIKYYQMSIACGNIDALLLLGYYYQDIKNYDNMIKYFLMAIDKDDMDAMSALGNHYSELKDHANAVKYLKMAVDKGCAASMANLGIEYARMKDTPNMMKYFMMSIEKGCHGGMTNMGVHYSRLNDHDNMLKYWIMACGDGHGDTDAMFKLSGHYKELKDYDNMVKYLVMAIDKLFIDDQEDLYVNDSEIQINKAMRKIFKYYSKHDAKKGYKIFVGFYTKGIYEAMNYAKKLVRLDDSLLEKCIDAQMANKRLRESNKILQKNAE
jgi:TPR repeat protein